MNENVEVARLLGQAYWRQEFLKANAAATADDLKQHLQSDWRPARKEYTRIGMQMLRAIERQGYTMTRLDGADVTASAGADPETTAGESLD